MKQLLIDVRSSHKQSLDNFFIGQNEHLIYELKQMATGPTNHILLWGQTGKTHLLRSFVNLTQAQYLKANELNSESFIGAPFFAIDDIDQLNDNQQILLFNAFNRAQQNGFYMLLSAPASAANLSLREDLRTRVGQCLSLQINEGQDSDKTAIMCAVATRYGFKVDEKVINYLLNHASRDINHLLNILEKLEYAALEKGRQITLPFLNQMIKEGLQI